MRVQNKNNYTQFRSNFEISLEYLGRILGNVESDKETTPRLKTFFKIFFCLTIELQLNNYLSRCFFFLHMKPKFVHWILVAISIRRLILRVHNIAHHSDPTKNGKLSSFRSECLFLMSKEVLESQRKMWIVLAITHRFIDKKLLWAAHIQRSDKAKKYIVQ